MAMYRHYVFSFYGRLWKGIRARIPEWILAGIRGLFRIYPERST